MYDTKCGLTLGKEMKELCEISTFSNWVHSDISSGKADKRLWERLSSEKRNKIEIYFIMQRKINQMVKPWIEFYFDYQ